MDWVMGGDTGDARAGLVLNQDHIFRPWKARTGAQWWGDSRGPSLVSATQVLMQMPSPTQECPLTACLIGRCFPDDLPHTLPDRTGPWSVPVASGRAFVRTGKWKPKLSTKV